MRRQLHAKITLGLVEDESVATPGKMGASYVRSILHEEALDERDFEVKVTASDHKSKGILELHEDQELILTGVD